MGLIASIKELKKQVKVKIPPQHVAHSHIHPTALQDDQKDQENPMGPRKYCVEEDHYYFQWETMQTSVWSTKTLAYLRCLPWL